MLWSERDSNPVQWPERDSNPDFYDAVAVLYQLSYQANWELVIMWVDVSPEMMSIDP